MGTVVVIIVATILVASITFLVLGMIHSQGGPKATGGHRWAAQASLAEMRKEGSAACPRRSGQEANRSEGPPGGEPGTVSRRPPNPPPVLLGLAKRLRRRRGRAQWDSESTEKTALRPER